MNENVVTIKVYRRSRATLKTLAAMKDEDMLDAFDRVVSKELSKLEKRKQSNKKIKI